MGASHESLWWVERAIVTRWNRLRPEPSAVVRAKRVSTYGGP